MATLLLGTSGWSYSEWVGPFYPSPNESKLKFYSRIFPIAEIDSTFYAYPQPGTVMGWSRYTPKGFQFAAKVPQLITHEKMLKHTLGVENDLLRFIELMNPLIESEKLACLLLQMPPSFKFDPDNLEAFFEILPTTLKFAIEFRHPSWMRPETWRLLSKYQVAYTIVDEPLLPPEVHLTSSIAYIRWHGRGKRPWYDYKYNTKELDGWVPRVEESIRGSSKVYGFFNNHYHGYAVENCLQILEMLGSITKEQLECKRRIEQYRKSHAQTTAARQIEEYL